MLNSESYQAALQSLDHMRSVVLSCRYQIPSSLVGREAHDTLVNTFEQAVARVVLKHPHMAVGLIDEHTDEPSWISLASINLDRHIEWHVVENGGDALQNKFQLMAHSELDVMFIKNPDIPGWRLKVLRQKDRNSLEVILAFSHINVDAHSAQLIHWDILKSLHDDAHLSKDVPLAQHILTIPDDLALKLAPPPEAIIEFPIDGDLMRPLQDTSEDKRSTDAMQAHWAPIAPLPFKTQYRSITISNRRVQELVQACRQNNVTITSLFHVLVLCSLTPLLEASSASAFSSMTAMDIRRFLPSDIPFHQWFDPANAASNYVTILGHSFNERLVALVRSCLSSNKSATEQPGVPMYLIWSNAKKVRHDITTKLDQGVTNDMIGFAQAITDWRTEVKAQTHRPRSASWVISNLGVIDGNPGTSVTASDSGWSIDHARFIMSANVVSAALSIAMVTIQGGDLSLSCTWQDCVIDPKIGEAFMANLSRWIDFVV